MKISLFLFLAAAASNLVNGREDIHVLMYETDSSLENDPTSPVSFFKDRSNFARLPTTIYGGGLEYHGFGDKYQTLKSLLEVVDAEKLVVIADARDVALNLPQNEEGANEAIDRFVETYHKLTADEPNAVVMSAESQCCVSAMTHAHPTEYFDPITKKRTKRACSSGHPGCFWEQNENIYAWVDFQRERAFNKTGIERVGEHVGDVYLNAGLMAGYPADLLRMIGILDIAPSEDDQAVLSGLMYQFPDMIVLDYDQEMFGNNQWPLGLEKGCVFEKMVDDEEPTQSTLVHPDTNSKPLIIHTPGKFYGCLDILIEELGGTSQQRYLAESPGGNPRVLRRGGEPVTTATPNNNDEGKAPIPSRKLEEECECECDVPSHRSLMNLLGSAFSAFGSNKIRGKTLIDERNIKPKILEDRDFERLVTENAALALAETEVEETPDANYGNYGVTNYGGYGQYGVVDSNYGQYGVASDSCADICASKCSDSDGGDQYGNYGAYGNYGQYGVLRRRQT